jgi:peptidoglycan/xylan/chitin deacetylase (PgdA/CDA1 family)
VNDFFLSRPGYFLPSRQNKLVSSLLYAFFLIVSLLSYFWIQKRQLKQRVARLQAEDRFLYTGNINHKQVALTFDDGPDPNYTPQMLAILEQYGVKATFFCVGLNIVAYPEIVKQMHAAGHVIGNHSWSHPNLAILFKHTILSQLVRTSDAIQQTIGVRPIFFRPPYGALNASTLICTEDLDMTTVIWDVRATDWAKPGIDVIANRVIERTGNGSIVVLHDGGGDRSETVAALPMIIEELRSRGFQFVTLQQMADGLNIFPKNVGIPGADAWQDLLLQISLKLQQVMK